MLILSRTSDQGILIDGPCEIVVLEVDRGRVRLGFRADKSVKIVRTELDIEPLPGLQPSLHFAKTLHGLMSGRPQSPQKLEFKS